MLIALCTTALLSLLVGAMMSWASNKDEIDRLRGLLARVVKYCSEDRAVTPGSTRLARVVDEARAALSKAPR